MTHFKLHSRLFFSSIFNLFILAFLCFYSKRFLLMGTSWSNCIMKISSTPRIAHHWGSKSKWTKMWSRWGRIITWPFNKHLLICDPSLGADLLKEIQVHYDMNLDSKANLGRSKSWEQGDCQVGFVHVFQLYNFIPFSSCFKLIFKCLLVGIFAYESPLTFPLFRCQE
jgi:hypothetical protein